MLSTVGIVPSGLCAASGLTTLAITTAATDDYYLPGNSDVWCAPSCLSHIANSQVPSYSSSCPAYQDTALCDIIAGTDIASLVGMSMWSCGTDGQTTTDYCLWNGITCNNDGGITILDVEDLGVSGTLPTALGYFSRIVELYVNDNSFTGTAGHHS